jgi:hypothetical protein
MGRPMYRCDPELMRYATDAQRKCLEAINEHGSIRAAARALNVNYGNIRQALVRTEKKAAIHGYSPRHDMSKTVPEPYVVKGVSTYYDKDGKPRGQWVKSRLDDEKLDLIRREIIEALKEDMRRLPPLKGPKHTDEDLCTLYTLTDCHVGMYAWPKETGAAWDLQIAEETLTKAFEYLVTASPAAKVGIVNELGDFNHFDSLEAITPTSRHQLDADSRFAKVVRVAVRVLRRVVDIALMKHETVYVVIKEGNHDMASSVWLREVFALLYENEPRVKVLDDETPFSAIQHGSTFLGFHHGHMVKNQSLPLLFAARYREMWGQTTRGYIHTGHRHHVEEKEHPGVKVIQHPTMAAPDSYNVRNGYVSEREMTSMTYHTEFGQVARNTVTPEMLA